MGLFVIYTYKLSGPLGEKRIKRRKKEVKKRTMLNTQQNFRENANQNASVTSTGTITLTFHLHMVPNHGKKTKNDTTMRLSI